MAAYEVTSYNTKKLLAASFVKLLMKKPIQKISIREVVEDCKLNRQTFYYHFKDVYDLCDWTIKELTQEVIKGSNYYESWEEAMLVILRYMKDNQDLVLCLYSSMGKTEIKKIIYSEVYEFVRSGVEKWLIGKSLDEKKSAFIVEFYTTAFAGVTENWIVNGMKEEPKYLVNMLAGIVKGGLESTLTYFMNHSELEKTGCK